MLACGALGAVVLAGPGGTDVSRYKVGKDPIDIVAADFNRDGRADLAVTNFQGDPQSISILRGRAGGSFAAAKKIELGPADQPHGIAAARLGKGKDPELVVGSLGDDVLVFKGRKGVGFKQPVRLPVGEWPRRVAVGDFDRDGRRDLAISRQDSDDLAVMLGEGGLGFGPPTLYGPAGGGPILAARLDAGNDLDLLTIDYDNGGLTLRRGLAGASFSAPVPLLLGEEPVSIAVVDLNRDGRNDIVAGLVGDRPRLLVARGEAGGGFAPTETITVGSGPMFVRDITVTRLNRDRDPDLVIAGLRIGGIRARGAGGGQAPRSRVIFLRGRGGIKLKRVREFRFRGQANAVAAARFDGGRPWDAAVARGNDQKRGHAVVILNP